MNRLVVVGAASFAAARGVRWAERSGRLPGGADRWARTNHQGRTVTLAEGPALAVGGAAPLVLVDPPAACVVALTAAVGAYDDLGGRVDVKGLRGHLAALRRGEVTSGAVKVVGLLTAGLVAAVWSDRRAGRPVGAATLAGAALVAGAANLANLFDLRPGRALKVGLLHGIPLAVQGRPAAAAMTGAALAVLPDDLAARSMLGDTGANPLGALVGTAAVQALGPRGRLAALTVVTGLTLLSERVSFTRVIESTPLLRELDRWGR